MSRLILFGAGVIAEQAYSYFADDTDHEVVAFTIDRAYKTADELFGLPVVPFEEVADRFPPDGHAMFVAVGYQELNSLRAARCDAARSMGYQLASYVSSRAFVGSHTQIGENCLIGEFTAIGSHARIGHDVFIFGGSYVGHHSSVGDHCYLASGVVVSGGTQIDRSCFVGVNATIGHAISVGERSFVGAGALITKSVAAGGVHIVADTPRYRLDSAAFLRLTKMR